MNLLCLTTNQWPWDVRLDDAQKKGLALTPLKTGAKKVA
jgi:hypothetical protein